MKKVKKDKGAATEPCCPACGYCPHCGQSKQLPAALPYVPLYISPTALPWWYKPVTWHAPYIVTSTQFGANGLSGAVGGGQLGTSSSLGDAVGAQGLANTGLLGQGQA